MFTDWLINQFVSFNVLTMVVIVAFNYITTTISINRQMKEDKLYHELEELKEEINKTRN